MKKYIFIITLIWGFSSYSQTAEAVKKGKEYSIKTMVTDSITKDTLRLAIVELMNINYETIKVTRSDFDGLCLLSVCSNLLINDSLLIKISKADYKQEIFTCNVVSDTIVNITLLPDVNKTFTKENFEAYNERFLYSDEYCLVEESKEVMKMKYQANKNTYKHYCTGEIKNYRNLIDDKEEFSDWIIIKE